MTTAPDKRNIAGVTVDPAAMFREMLGQWEAMANQFGGQAMRSPETARLMGAATSATAQAHEAARDGMARMLAAANMPSRAEVTSLSERIAAIDERLARIEALLTRIAGDAAPPPPARPKPARTRKPPQAAA